MGTGSETKKDYKGLLFYGVVALLFLFTRLYKITEIPKGFNTDELAMAYNVKSLLENHIDRYGVTYPLYFNNVMSGQSALFTYAAYFMCKVFGYNEFIFRLTAVLFGALTIIYISKAVKEMADSTTAKIASLLVIILPFFVMSERWDLDCYAAAPMTALVIYCAVIFLKKGSYRSAIALGMASGLCLYSYILSVILILGFLLIVLGTYIIKRRYIKQVLVVILTVAISGWGIIYYVGILLFGLPEIRTKFFCITKVSNERVSELGFHINSIQQLLDRILIMFSHDQYKNIATDKYGTLFSRTLALGLAFCGLIILFQELRKKIYMLPLMAAILSNLVLVIVLDEMVIYRHSSAFVCIVMLLAFSIGKVLQSKWFSKVSKMLGLLILIYYAVIFTRFYTFILADTDIAKYSDSGLTAVIRELDEKDKIVYVDDTADYAAYLCALYGADIDSRDLLNTVTNYDKYNMRFSNYQMSIPENALGSDAVFVIRDYEKFSYVYALRGNAITDAYDRVNSYMQYSKTLENMGYKKLIIGNYNIYRR